MSRRCVTPPGLRPLISTLPARTQALARAIWARATDPHPYQGAEATHTVTTPYGRLQVCRVCYVDCMRTYPGVNSVKRPQAGRLDGRCQCEHDKHFLGVR